MHRTLPAVVADLEIRADALLRSISASPPAELSERVHSIRVQAEMLQGEARALRAALGDPGDAPGHFDRHMDLNRILRQLELYDLPLLQRWSTADRLMTQMCNALLRQVGWSFDRPLVGCFSSDYYWTHPVRRIIGVPANEERRLLAIGDLGHELGHLAFVEDSLQFAGRVLIAVAHYAQAQGASPPADLQDDPLLFFAELSLSWRTWLPEFGCDAFATYLTGPAFAWQHLRLACLEDTFPMLFAVGFGLDHPADDARMRLSLMMLREFGHARAAQEIAEHWSDLLDLIGATPSPEYAAAYPDELLREVVISVKARCEAIGLRPYDPDAGDDDVARLANEAWTRLHQDPDTYAEWEQAALEARREAWAS